MDMYVGCKRCNGREKNRQPWKFRFKSLFWGTKASKINRMCATVWSVPKRCSTRTASSSGGSSKTSSRPPPSTSQAFQLSSVQPLVTGNFPRITGHTKCQQFYEREDHLQKGFRLYPLQVKIASNTSESLAGVTWKAANTSATGAVSTWQRRNLWTTKCLFPLWPDWTGSMCWWKRHSRTQTRLLRKEERRSPCASNHLICRFFFVD